MHDVRPWHGQPPRRIAIFRATFRGDLLCSLPVLRALRLAYTDAEITLICLSWAREFVERIPYLDHFGRFPAYSSPFPDPHDRPASRRLAALLPRLRPAVVVDE